MTIKEFMEFDPCYSEEHIREIAGEKEDWTALDILTLDNVPAEDRLWAVLRPEFIDDKALRLFAVWCARQCNQTDPVCINAIDVAERYAHGNATDAELSDAGYAARSAALNAARFAALNAAWSAAWSAARDVQVAHLIEMLEEAEDDTTRAVRCDPCTCLPKTANT